MFCLPPLGGQIHLLTVASTLRFFGCGQVTFPRRFLNNRLVSTLGQHACFPHSGPLSYPLSQRATETRTSLLEPSPSMCSAAPQIKRISLQDCERPVSFQLPPHVASGACPHLLVVFSCFCMKGYTNEWGWLAWVPKPLHRSLLPKSI